MSKAKITEADISELKQDERNLNLHTERGNDAIKKSIEKFGLGRSVLVDKNNKIIAGNATTEQALKSGKKKVLIVEADRDTLVAVKRPDLDLDTDSDARELALADNATAHMNLNFNIEEAQEQGEEFGFDIGEWGVTSINYGNMDMLETVNNGDENSEWLGMPEFTAKEDTLKIIIHFKHENDRQEFSEKHELEFNTKHNTAWSTTYPFIENSGTKGLKYDTE